MNVIKSKYQINIMTMLGMAEISFPETAWDEPADTTIKTYSKSAEDVFRRFVRDFGVGVTGIRINPDHCSPVDLVRSLEVNDSYHKDKSISIWRVTLGYVPGVNDDIYDPFKNIREEFFPDEMILESSDLDDEVNKAATSPENDLPEPTEGQKKSGGYKKGHVRIAGLEIAIENPAGSERSGTDPGGKKWSIKMVDHYGYVKGSIGHDKDHVDVFINPDMDMADIAEMPVFVVDQINADGSFDEAKCMMGYATKKEASKAYFANYEKGWTGLGAITETTMGKFKLWVMDKKKTKKKFVLESAGNKADIWSAKTFDELKTIFQLSLGINGGKKKKTAKEEIVYRFTREKGSPLSSVSYSMWGKDPEELEDVYGPYGWEADVSDLPHISDFYDDMIKAFREDEESGMLPPGIEHYTENTLTEETDPEDIVNAAEAWDDPDFVEWFWDKIGEQNDLDGIKLTDGAILFDQSRAKRYIPGDDILESAYRDDYGGYGCLLVELPEAESMVIRNFAYSLPENDLAKHPDTGEPWVEHKSHISIRYGLLPTDTKSVESLVKGVSNIRGAYGKLGVFQGEKHDVLFVKAHSADLFSLHHESSRQLPCIEAEYQYSPHVTIAYLNKGTGAKYEGMSFFVGVRFSFDQVTYSDQNGNSFPIKL